MSSFTAFCIGAASVALPFEPLASVVWLVLALRASIAHRRLHP